MKKPLVTLEYLEKEVWWWNWEKIRRLGVFGVAWDHVSKEAARNYELMRRARGGKQFPKTYLELNTDQRSFVHGLWCNWPEQPWQPVNPSNQLGRR